MISVLFLVTLDQWFPTFFLRDPYFIIVYTDDHHRPPAHIQLQKRGKVAYLLF